MAFPALQTAGNQGLLLSSSHCGLDFITMALPSLHIDRVSRQPSAWQRGVDMGCLVYCLQHWVDSPRLLSLADRHLQIQAPGQIPHHQPCQDAFGGLGASAPLLGLAC